MDYENVSFFEQIRRSITDFSFYRYFRSQGIEKAFKYLFLITITLGTISLIKPLYDYNSQVAGLLNYYKNSVPDFQLKNGELSVSGNQPIIIDENNNVLIIDTTGQTDEKVLDKYENIIFISKTEIVQKENGHITNSLNFKDIEGLTLTKSQVQGWLPFLRWINLFIIVFGLLWFFISKLFSILVLSVVSLIVCGISRFNVKYGDLIKMSFYALTLPIIIKILVKAFELRVPFFSLIYYAIGTYYICMAAKSMKIRPEEETLL